MNPGRDHGAEKSGWYAQEYGCAFVEAIGQVFSDAAIDAAFSHDVAPLFAEEAADDGSLVELPPLFAEV